MTREPNRMPLLNTDVVEPAAPPAKANQSNFAPWSGDVVTTPLSRAMTPVETLVHAAIQQGTNTGDMKDLYEILRAEQEREAKRKFADALALFQAECPIIIPDQQSRYERKIVDDRGVPSVAPGRCTSINRILSTVVPVLSRHGLACHFSEVDSPPATVAVQLVVDGYGLTVPMTTSTMPIVEAKSRDGKVMQTPYEQRLSALTYAKKDAILSGLALRIEGESELADRIAEPVEPVTEKDLTDINDTLIRTRDRTGYKIEEITAKVLQTLGVEALADLPSSAVADIIARLDRMPVRK